MKIAAASDDLLELRAFLGWLYDAESKIRVEGYGFEPPEENNSHGFFEATITFDDDADLSALVELGETHTLADVAAAVDELMTIIQRQQRPQGRHQRTDGQP